jgi:aquaporin Z
VADEPLTPGEAMRKHWPEYLMEAWGLGTFMVSAGLVTTLLEYPHSPIEQAIGSPDLRRVLIGLAMGFTAIAIIYSPWGKRCGAHLNPAVTLTFLRLGKIKALDACPRPVPRGKVPKGANSPCPGDGFRVAGVPH